ncbi:RTA1 domain-containing protein [Colletotrichum somersetense]|nr:RTA1 domain-containing protein [Colletotrichum somersetense]
MQFSRVILAMAASTLALALSSDPSTMPTLLGHVNIPAKTIDIAIPTCIQTIKPDSNGYVPPGECGAIWNYYPSFIAAVVFTGLFALLTVIHIWQAARHKKQSDGVYLVFQIFILLAPIWVNAFAYMTLGRMIYFFHPSRSLLRIPAPTFAAIFVGLDIISFAVQLAGGSMAGPTAPPAEQMKAIHIYMGGIGLQEFFILIFVGLALKFRLEIQRMEKFHGAQPRPWKPLMWALYFSLSMITIRIIYRLVEFSSGHGVDNVLITHESYFYVLEALPMFLAIAVFNAVHPAATINGAGSDMPGLLLAIKNGFSRRNGRIPLKEDVEEQELTRRRSLSS